MDAIRFNDLIFSAEMLSARRNDGTEIRFTRKERALLKEFVAKSNTVLTRHKLLEALHRDDQGDISERNIDFLVNRLRTKLGDKARDPRFIASQYGEGYIWIAESIDETQTNAFLQIGPVYGLTETDNGERAILDLLTTTLNSVTDKKASIVCTRALQPHADQFADYVLEASFYKDDTRLHAAFVLRHLRRIGSNHLVDQLLDRTGVSNLLRLLALIDSREVLALFKADVEKLLELLGADLAVLQQIGSQHQSRQGNRRCFQLQISRLQSSA